MAREELNPSPTLPPCLSLAEVTPNGVEGSLGSLGSSGSGSGTAEEQLEGEPTMAQGFGISSLPLHPTFPPRHIPEHIPAFPVLVSPQMTFVMVINWLVPPHESQLVGHRVPTKAAPACLGKS